MARIRRIFRTRLWLYSLLCVLSVVAKSEAATRVPVKPTSETVIGGARTGAISTPAGDVAFYGADKVYSFTAGDSVAPTVREVKSTVGTVSFPYGPEAAYPNGTGISSSATKIKVKPVAVVPKRNIGTGLKNLIKTNPAQVALGVATSAALAGVGWVMDTSTQSPVILKPSPLLFEGNTVTTVTSGFNPLACSWGSGRPPGIYVESSSSPSLYKIFKLPGSAGTGWVYISNCTSFGWATKTLPGGIATLPAPTNTPIVDSDLSAIDPWVNSQTASFLGDLLKEVCKASLSPSNCYSEMEDRSKRTLQGPATAPGPWFTKTSTFPRPDGTTGTKTETTSTKYDFTYGPEHFDVNPERKTTTTEDGIVTSETTETDSTAPEDVSQSPDEEPKKEETPIPCTSNCDGPAYVDMYDKTDKTKEGELDSYKGKIQGVPIIAAVSGLFNVSVSAACPVWSYSGTLELVGASMPIDLVFDFQCQPWFTDLRPYVQAIMLIVCGLLAVRIGLL